MSSETIEQEAARIVGMTYRTDMRDAVKAVLLARDTAIADARVLALECHRSRRFSAACQRMADDPTPRANNEYENRLYDLNEARAATDASGALERCK